MCAHVGFVPCGVSSEEEKNEVALLANLGMYGNAYKSLMYGYETT
jgi:hypothetical protein